MSELISPTPALAGPLREALNLLKDGQTTTITLTRQGEGAYVCIATTPAPGETGEHYPSVAGEVQVETIDQEIAASYREQLPARISIAAATVTAVQKSVASSVKAQTPAKAAPATPSAPAVPAGSIVTTAAPAAAGTLKPLPMGGMTLTSGTPSAQMPPPAKALAPALFDD